MLASIDFAALAIQGATFSAILASSIAAMATALYFALVASEARHSARMALFVAGCASADPSPPASPVARIVDVAVALAPSSPVASAARAERMIVRPDPEHVTRYEARRARDGRFYVVRVTPGERARIIAWTAKGAENQALALVSVLSA